MASTASATRPRSLDPPQGKSLDKASVRNTFLWTNWPNGDTGHLDAHHSDRQFLTNLKDGSVYSLTAPRSSVSSYTREASLSKDSSSHSLGNGSQRDMKDSGRGSVTLDRDLARKSSDTGHDVASVTASIASQPVNGTTPPAPRKTLVNGDHTFVDRLALSDTDVPRSSTTRLSSSQPEPRSFLSPDVDGFPSNKASAVHRYSSPPAPPSGMDGGQFQDQTTTTTSNLRNRNTLHPRRGSVGRRNSRDQSDDTAYSTARRTSQSLMRRSTRTNNSDSHPDDANPDDDAARWAKAVKQQRQYKRKRRDEDDDDRVIVGTKVDQNHVNWVTAYNMLTGIRFTVSRINAKMDRELTPADFQAKHKFSFDITGNELTPSAKYDFKFKDYAPWVFRHLRAKFRLDPADYLMSLTSKYILSELGSPGKSGSFFYFSRDYKYIIKTIHHSEHKLLRKILPEYYKHVEENPNTLISQFYGLHRVKMAYGRKIHFVVMNNLFPPHRDIHQTFDLKGSTIGRDLSEDDLKKNPRGTMKDLNWIRRHRHIECGPQKREVFITQLKRDVELLKRLKIMDYSLLVGIHDLERGNDEKLRNKTLQVFQPVGDRDEDSNPNVLMRTPSRLENERKARELRMLIQRERPVPLDQAAAKMPDEILDERKSHIFYSDDGGFRATDENGQYRDEIYYLGIIDFLTHYGMVKRIEHFVKGLSHDRTQISPIPPQSYGERFYKFIDAITMSKEEADRSRRSADNNCRSSSVERQLQAAEKQAAKEPHPAHPRTLSTVWTPGDAEAGASALPIVEEAGESSSTGGQSQHGENWPLPNNAEKDLPPLPNEGSSHHFRHIPHHLHQSVEGKGKGTRESDDSNRPSADQ